MNSTFFAMISRMKYINRWSLMRNSRIENISEHSHQVSIISHALAVLTNERFGGNIDEGRCVLLSIYHDAEEIITGDLPTPIKYFNEEIKAAYKEVEHVASQSLVERLPGDIQKYYTPLLLPNDDFPEERKIVKVADKISALIKCVEELAQGNNEFKNARDTIEKTIININLPAANMFLKEFLPAYELTLDDQNKKEMT